MNRQKVTSGFAGNLIGASIASFIALTFLWLCVSTGHCAEKKNDKPDQVSVMVSPRIVNMNFHAVVIMATVLVKNPYQLWCNQVDILWGDGTVFEDKQETCDPLAPLPERWAFTHSHPYIEKGTYTIVVVFTHFHPNGTVTFVRTTPMTVEIHE